MPSPQSPCHSPSSLLFPGLPPAQEGTTEQLQHPVLQSLGEPVLPLQQPTLTGVRAPLGCEEVPIPSLPGPMASPRALMLPPVPALAHSAGTALRAPTRFLTQRRTHRVTASTSCLPSSYIQPPLARRSAVCTT